MNVRAYGRKNKNWIEKNRNFLCDYRSIDLFLFLLFYFFFLYFLLINYYYFLIFCSPFSHPDASFLQGALRPVHPPARGEGPQLAGVPPLHRRLLLRVHPHAGGHFAQKVGLSKRRIVENFRISGRLYSFWPKPQKIRFANPSREDNKIHIIDNKDN